MLATLTFTTDLIAMGLTLWLAFYLFARGFPNRITLRAILCLLALSTFFLGAYNNYFVQIPGTAALRAVLLIIGLGSWYSVTFQLLSPQKQAKLRWKEISIYALCAVTAILLASTRNSFVKEQGNSLYVAHMQGGLPYTLYGFAQIVTTLAMFFNLHAERRIRFTAEGRFFLLTTIFPLLTVGYGIFALILTEPPMPRLVQDILVFSGVFLLGISVARYQSLIERRTILQDFVAICLTMFGLMFVYVFICLELGLPLPLLGGVTALVITTHSIYDLSREMLERLRIQNESQFRRQLHVIENADSNEKKLQFYLHEGLDLLCKTLNASAGLIAVWRGDKAVVMAARNSVEVGSEIFPELAEHEDISPISGRIANIAWVAPAFEGQNQIALVGIGVSNTKLDYSQGDLDLFAEFAEQVGTVVSIANIQPQENEQVRQDVDKLHYQAAEMRSAAGEMISSLSSSLDMGFIKIVEDGLRKYADFVALGRSPLAERLGVTGASQVERGKQLQGILRQAIDSLRPAGTRPGEPLPRSWYNFAVLHDAYVEGLPNREVMARLYISEGTFNRTRRNALRGVARWLVDEKNAVKP